QVKDRILCLYVTGVQTCSLPLLRIGSPPDCTHGNFEFLTTNCADSGCRGTQPFDHSKAARAIPANRLSRFSGETSTVQWSIVHQIGRASCRERTQSCVALGCMEI